MCTRSRSELDGSNSTTKSMSLSEVASPRATELNTAIERPRCRRTRSRIFVRFRSTIEFRSGPAAMATPYDLGLHRAGPSPSCSASGCHHPQQGAVAMGASYRHFRDGRLGRPSMGSRPVLSSPATTISGAGRFRSRVMVMAESGWSDTALHRSRRTSRPHVEAVYPC
jgi:hypothetical protein